jgi:hypothetical protein
MSQINVTVVNEKLRKYRDQGKEIVHSLQNERTVLVHVQK